MTIIGVLEKQGESVIGVSRDYSVLIGNNFAKKIIIIVSIIRVRETK